MTFTSVLHSPRNPFPGKIFTNSASTTDGDWAKYGCFEHVDYEKPDINKDVFLAILSGDAETVKQKTGKENPKVLNAGPDDTVFTYFIDHGDEDLIIIGRDYVYSEELLAAFKTAREKQLYGKWLWFIEACFSGSMFAKLPADWNIYVMTSADAEHEADMSNCPPDDVVGGRIFSTCLSGLWDNSYLDYMESHPDCTIGEIFDFVHEDVAKESDQNVSQFGDMTFRDLKLSEFVGTPSRCLRSEKKTSGTSVPYSEVPAHLAKWEAIRADSSDLEAAMLKYQEVAFADAKKEVEVMRLGRALLNEKAAAAALKTSTNEYSVDCVRELTLSLVKKCGHTIPLPMSANNMLRNICAPGMNTPNVDFSDICM